MSTEELRKHADAMKKYIVSERERISVNLKKDDNIAKDELHPKVELGCPACHKNPCICESEEICPKCGKEICECGNAPEQMVTEDGNTVGSVAGMIVDMINSVDDQFGNQAAHQDGNKIYIKTKELHGFKTWVFVGSYHDSTTEED